ncbi:tRNA (adenosine(37)-N6)-threonylcarbamoyltransferase complex ATPase subunit type 1 TsaE [Subsaximicrobium wynnwilliamsii]|uniref:tRNA threonylcarbamoyladenosine biosynthesis protein TsaE n=1 Tax=Subsaximicrobium wynnwilliamsii TaxID=291179 RepID=A0A5C6ZG36_9FLAO|nr:tRNA (adenosine(37)-N6)-threonylcarbamoyltransferase complex ATPase subunit type 1 TsaE [Subsaximicrobium wynnwilliamsii]TXD84147.1 tRNA (adenosine(37)-N6)-threonylcarbamoyltransferase complex ATPase subunit type 1 TsaE [Subsaximicrobium wynnwilliamsii]TXD88895.1 tRNA (adenosine(37)-N6)-threonylcarbamoyltransferase complex ATPase subunit type 1 TsaE [Subsaximicrobium wynnwilliamsii]TXE03859.1 tRNA (adenosine(37)-N6)-threonylcarbamoyltransferase complex ATPase subunit type 1 TsaE [Subsaximicro
MSYDLSQVDAIAKQVLEQCNCKVILFQGEIGAGKTTLVKALVGRLGSVDEVSSPTFSIVNEYLLEDGAVFHFDLYRINSEDELLDLGFEDYINTNNWIFIEWPEKAFNLLPESWESILIKHINQDERALIMSHNLLKTQI